MHGKDEKKPKHFHFLRHLFVTYINIEKQHLSLKPEPMQHPNSREATAFTAAEVRNSSHQTKTMKSTLGICFHWATISLFFLSRSLVLYLSVHVCLHVCVCVCMCVCVFACVCVCVCPVFSLLPGTTWKVDTRSWASCAGWGPRTHWAYERNWRGKD